MKNHIGGDERAGMSPSMRRVWIEIRSKMEDFLSNPSPSMRRVWIEIALAAYILQQNKVTLHAEGVD